MKEQLQLSAAQETLSKAPIGILLLDANNNVLWHNDTLVNYLGIDDDQIAGRQADDMPAELRGVLLDPPDTILLQQGDEQRWLNCRCQENGASGRTLFYLDITEEQLLKLERDKLAEDLQQLTTRDPVTGLPNRRALLQGLEPLVSRSRRYNNPLSIIMLSIGNNISSDQQEEGWTKVGHLLKDQMRWADIIGRYDGSDFLLILPETTQDAASSLAEKICNKLSELDINSESIQPYCGVCGWNKGDDSNLLLKRVKDRANAAKSSGVAIVETD